MAGFDALDTDILALADADGSVPANSLADVIQQIRDGTADVSLASRRHRYAHPKLSSFDHFPVRPQEILLLKQVKVV